jgi:hypothetical protein
MLKLKLLRFDRWQTLARMACRRSTEPPKPLLNLGVVGDVGQRQVASMCDTKAILIDLATNYEQYKTKSYAFSAGKINIGTICLADAMLDFALVMASYSS